MKETFYERIGEAVCRERLSNGLEVCVVPKPGYAKKYAFFSTRYGGMDTRFCLDGQWLNTPAGIAHYLEHKMFDTREGNALQELAKNGAEPNAFTANAMTAYYFDSTEHFEENLRILLSFVSIPYFTDESVAKEQGIIGQEIRMIEDNPDWQIYTRMLRAMYHRHAARTSIAGTVESIAEITADTLYDCHKAFYTPANMILTVVGDVDPVHVIDLANRVLPKLSGPIIERDYGTEPETVAEKETVLEMEVSAPQFLIGVKIAPAQRGSENLRQRLVAQLALRLLAGGSSPFYSRLYAEGLLCRDFDYEVDFAAGTGTVIFGGESQQPERVLEELKAEAARISAEGFEPERFERAKRASFGARLRGFEDFDNVCVSLAGAAFDGYDAFAAPAVLSEVTADECAAFIRENLAPERLAISIITPARN